MRKRVSAEVLEVVLLVLMILFGAVAILIFAKALNLSQPDPLIVILELLLLILISVLALTFICVKIWEQHIKPEYLIKHHRIYNNVMKGKKRRTPKKRTRRKK